MAEIAVDGTRANGFFYADGELIATQSSGTVFWQHRDPSNRSRRTIDSTGAVIGKDEVDPMDVTLDDPRQVPRYHGGGGGGGRDAGGEIQAHVASLMDTSMCDAGGLLVPCGMVQRINEQIGQSPRELQMFWNYGLWLGANESMWDLAFEDVLAGATQNQLEQLAQGGLGALFFARPDRPKKKSGPSSVAIMLIQNWLMNQTQNPRPTPPAQPLPPNYRPPKDLEEPCIRRIGTVMNDLRKIAQMVHGRLTGYDFTSQKRHAFPGADINSRGQSFGQAISRLKNNGFEPATVLGIQWSHSEGAGYQKPFSDGLWYHVIVNFPTGMDSSNADPRRPTPLITAHCHATNPTGVAHALDSIP